MVIESVVVTTSTHPSSDLEVRARRIAGELGAPYVPRHSDSLASVIARTEADQLLLVCVNRIGLHDTTTGTEYFFHPNMISVRAHHQMRGERDLFLEATGLESGDSHLDCTLGFAAEATLAAITVGIEGTVVGLESVPALAAVTQEGLQTFPMPQPQIAQAMRRVQVVTADYREYLKKCDSDIFDVVYFDPFFHERLSGAETSVSPLAHFGNNAPLESEAVQEARRVARRCVVIKHPHHEPLPMEIAQAISRTVTTRHSRLIYSILSP
jgi:16S rRNA (guanine1516-N2)-methyltransferase